MTLAARHLRFAIPALIAAAALIVPSLVTLPAHATTITAAPTTTPGDRVIVEYAPEASASARAQARSRGQARLVKSIARTPLEVVELPAGADPELAAAAIEGGPDVVDARVDRVVARIGLTPTDSYFAPYQWALANSGQTIADIDGVSVQGVAGADIDATTAWNTATGGVSKVAVLDTGVDYSHFDLVSNMWKNTADAAGNGVDDDGNGCIDDYHGYNATKATEAACNDVRDDNGHGTKVSGVIAAEGSNGGGIAGINWDARIMPVKIADSAGVIRAAAQLLGMQYAVEKGARVVNGSFGGVSPNADVASLIIANPEVLFVFSAGNGGYDLVGDDNDVYPFYPCNVPAGNVICVASSDNRDQLSEFSNRGAVTVDLLAPGEGVISTRPKAASALGGGANDLAFSSGTSLAAPYVAGAASLLLGRDPQLTIGQAATALLNNVDRDLAYCGKVKTAGRLNVAAAFEALATPAANGPQGDACPLPVDQGSSTDWSVPAPAPASTAPPAAIADTTAPAVTITRRSVFKVGSTGRVSFGVRCDEACAVTSSSRAHIAGMPAISQKLSLVAGEAGTVAFAFRDRRLAQVKSMLRRKSRVRLHVAVTAVDSAGNKSVRAFTARLAR